MFAVQPPPPPDSAAGADAASAADDGGADRPRNDQAWKGSNIFLFEGRLIFGPDARSLLITMFLIVAPIIVFCVFVARELMVDFPHHSGTSILVIVVVLTFLDLIFLLLTSGRDPGILPRNTQPPEPEGYEAHNEFPGHTPPFHLPRTKDVMVNGVIMRTKYCDICMLYRPPRCSHCSICNNCVERFDHHCPWVGQCIGLSTYENFRYRYGGLPSPFDRGIIKNFKETFFSSVPPSKNNFRAKVPKGLQIPGRTVGSSLINSKIETIRDVEMRMKPKWDESADNGDIDERSVRNDSYLHEDDGFTDVAADLSWIIPPEGMEGRSVLHSRRSSLGRKSGSWEMPPDVHSLAAAAAAEEAKQVLGGNGVNLSSESQQ